MWIIELNVEDDKSLKFAVQQFGLCSQSLEDMLKKARAGKPIDEDEIPPPVAMVASSNKPTPQPSTNAEVNRARSVSPGWLRNFPK